MPTLRQVIPLASIAARLLSLSLVFAAASCTTPSRPVARVLFTSQDLSGWRQPTGEWKVARAVPLDAADDKKFTLQPGTGVLVNGAKGRTVNLLSECEHGDVEAHIEFCVPKGSNSGVYFQGRYEVQILDSWGVEHPKYGDCGGIYQRWNAAPGVPDNERGYEGRAPSQNASKAPGEWQQFEITFRAPRFDADGKKTENARFVKVVHNGVTIHENVEVTGPTRSGRFEDEAPRGPLMIQGDHGPVALRNIRVMETRTEE